MRFHRSNNPIIFNYNLLGEELPTVKTIRDLGVVLDGSLSFVPHIEVICNKALQMLGFMKRVTSEFKHIHSIATLYFSLVRSHLEYCSSVWNPHYAVHVNKIEQIQHKFLRYAAYKLHIPSERIDYAVLESSLGMNTLSSRRRQHDAKLLFNLINYRSHDPQLLEKINFHVPPCNTRNTYLFAQPFHRTNYGYNSPVARLTRTANSLNLDFYGISFNQFLATLRRSHI